MKEMKLYLPFEVDFIQNDLHSELIERYGAQGLGIYFMVLMELRNHEGYRCSLSTIKGAARKCLVEPEMLESVLRDFGLFKFDECGDRILISSVYIDRVMQPFEEKTRSSSATVNEKTATVERLVHGMSTVSTAVIINIIKTKTTTTNIKAATAANVDAVAADAEVVNDMKVKATAPEAEKLWAEHLENAIANEQWVQLLAHFMRQATSTRKCMARLLRQHDLQTGKRSPWRFGRVDNGYRGEIEDVCASPRMLPSSNSNAYFIRAGCLLHLCQMPIASGTNEIGIQSRIG